MVDNGANCVVMEVSSIGVKSYRSYGIDFDYAVFTNFSSDHIGENEHKDLDEYFKFKNMLSNNCKNAVVNLDDEKSEKIISEHAGHSVKAGELVIANVDVTAAPFVLTIILTVPIFTAFLEPFIFSLTLITGSLKSLLKN